MPSEARAPPAIETRDLYRVLDPRKLSPVLHNVRH